MNQTSPNQYRTKDKIKVLFILNIPPPYGGGEIVSNIIYSRFKDKFLFYIRQRENYSKRMQSDTSLRSIIEGSFYILKVCKSIKKLEPQIIFIGVPKSFLAFFRNSLILHYAKKRHIEIIGDLHGMNFPFLNYKLLCKYYLYSINKISKLRVLSNSIKNYVKQTGYLNKLFVIDNGLDVPNTSQLNLFNNKYFKFLYFGTISESKGFMKVLQLLKELHLQKFCDMNLTVIGEWVNKNFMGECDRFIKLNNLKNIISFKGKVIGNTKWQEIAKTNLLLHFSEFDGQPLTILETLALGIPVIATKIGAIPETIIDNYNGFLVDDCINDSINILKKLNGGQIDYSLISQNAKYTYSKRFTTDILIRNIESLIYD